MMPYQFGLWNSIFLEGVRYNQRPAIRCRKDMKFGRTSVLNILATSVVLAILLSGGVYAYSTRRYLAAGALNAPSPLADDESSTASTSTTSSVEHHSANTHTETQQNNGQGDEDEQGENEQSELHFRLVPVSSGEGQGNVNIKVDDTTLDGQIEVEKLSPSTTYNVILVAIPTTTTATATTLSTTSSTTTTSTTTSAASCTGKSIGSFVTRGEGNGEAELSTTLSPGTYAIGIVLCSGSTPVLVSDPATAITTVPSGTEDEEETSTTETSGHETETHTVHTHTEEKDDEDQIKHAEDTKTIPAVVKVDSSGVSFNQLDPQFSVSASKLDNNGYQISISASGVTGSRVLLVNLTGSEWTASSLQSLTVTFDGQPIAEAASISQVLSSTSSDPARYIILVTSSGLQLLVSIPHFSLHTIQILPSAASALNFVAVNAQILLLALVVFTGLSVAVYSKRRRVFAFLA